MWNARWEMLNDDGLRLILERDQRPASFAEVFETLRDDAEFQLTFNRTLADVSFSAFRWELPALTQNKLDDPFECVVLNSPNLERDAEPDAFAEHYNDAVDGIARFSNLGGNAILIVPTPDPEAEAFTHLGAFVRNAPESQCQALWRAVGMVMAERLGTKPVWLNTAGAGVAWLHIRLDDRPKYYRYEPYKYH